MIDNLKLTSHVKKRSDAHVEWLHYDLECMILYFSSLKMVHKRSQDKLQERKDKSFSKRKKVSEHPNRLEWLLGSPLSFSDLLDR
jgi:hypothetical protein